MLSSTPFRGAETIIANQPHGLTLAIQQDHDETQLTESPSHLIALDGYIANWHRLTKSPRGSNDAQRLAHYLETRPLSALRHLDGEFATLIASPDAGLHLYTTIGGTRPLHMTRYGSNLYIATDIRALYAALDQSRPTTVNPAALVEYLLFNRSVLHPEQTYYQGIERIRPGRLYHFPHTTSTPTILPLWQAPDTQAPASNPHHAAAELRELITDACRSALPPESCALSLSGGLDSGSLWGSIRYLSRQGDRHASRVEAFSQIFPGQPCDESPILDAQEAFHRKAIIRINVSQLRNAELLPELDRQMDYLVAPNAYYYAPFYELLRNKGQHTLLMGIGGDEWLEPNLFHLGDEWRSGHYLSAFINAWSGNRWTTRRSLYENFRRAIKLTIGRQGSALRRHCRRRPPAWLHSEWHDLFHTATEKLERRCQELGVRRCRLLDTLDWFASYGMAPNQQFAAHYGIDIRHPMMHHSLIEFGFKTPARLLCAPDNEPKALLRTAMQERLPPRLQRQPGKPHFNIPAVNDPGLLKLLPDARKSRLVERHIVDIEWLETQSGAGKSRSLPPMLTRLLATELFLQRFSAP